MSTRQPPIERIVGLVLQFGSLAAVLFLTLGFVLTLLRAEGLERAAGGISQVSAGSLPLALISLGAALLFLTPFSAVIVTGAVFISRGEYKFALLVGLLIVVLVVGFLTAY
jgi:uncharacterized membrane protein